MSDTLRLGAGLELPVDVVTRATAIVGQRGTGKTSTAVVLVEEAAQAGARFAVVDPTGAWYGLRSSADGDGPGLDCVVMGGWNGDVPLDPASGELVARLVVEEGYSVVLDLERMTKGEQVRFVAEFSETAYHLCRSALLVVIDEAHRFAPQQLRDPGGYGARCLGAVTDVVTLGRRKGLGAVLISQRPAKINKDVFEQAEVMIAHRLMGPNDRKAIGGWLEEAGEGAGAGLADLARLDRGVALVHAPGYGVAGTYPIRAKETFDSSATPEVGGEVVLPKGRAEIDLGALEARMAETLQRAKDDDPKALRARIAKLEAELAQDRDTEAEDAYRAAHDRVAELEREVAEAWGQAAKAEHLLDAVRAALAGKSFTQDDGAARSAPAGAEGVHTAAAPPESTRTRRQTREQEANGGRHTPLTSPAGGGSSRQGPDAGAGAPSGPSTSSSLPRAALDLAETLAAFPDGLPRDRLALLTGRKPRGGSWNTAMKALAENGIAEDRGDVLVPTGRARELFPEARPLSGHELVEVWRGKLGAAARDLFDALVAAAPQALTLDELGARTGRAPRGGSWNTAVKQLRTSGLVVDVGRGSLRVDGDLIG